VNEHKNEVVPQKVNRSLSVSSYIKHNMPSQRKKSASFSRSQSMSSFRLGKLNKEGSLNSRFVESKMLEQVKEEDVDFGDLLNSVLQESITSPILRSGSTVRVLKPEISDLGAHRRTSTSVLVKLNDYG